jgi:hypothetical protein
MVLTQGWRQEPPPTLGFVMLPFQGSADILINLTDRLF